MSGGISGLGFACAGKGHRYIVAGAIFVVGLLGDRSWALSIEKAEASLGEQKAVVYTDIDPILVGERWNEKTVVEIYKDNVGADGVKTLDGLDLGMALSMFWSIPTGLIAGSQFLVDPLDEPVLNEIRDSCLLAFPNDPWKLLACVNSSVTLSVANYLGPNPTGILTACRAISASVQKIYNSYGIPGARVSVSNFVLSIDGSPAFHAVNTVTFTSPQGFYYAYRFDAGADPSNFYPATEITENFHRRNGRIAPSDVGFRSEHRFGPAVQDPK